MENFKFFVTGGNGFIGSHMCKFLTLNGHEVHFCDDFSTSPSEQIHNYGKFYPVSMASPEILSLFTEKKFDGVFHFAGRALVGESVEKPEEYFRVNLGEATILLDYAVQGGIPTFVFSSTCATYGQPQGPISESTQQNPINPYGKSKLLFEKVLAEVAEKKKISAVALRYFNVAGCDPQGELGENHQPETHLIPNLCLAALGEQSKAFKIFGTNFPTPDGTCVRDYIHVMDLVKAHYSAFEFSRLNKGFDAFNLGSGKGQSVREILETFQKVTGEKLEVTESSPRPGDPPSLVALADKAREKLELDLQFSLEDSITHTWEYFKKVRT